MEKERIKYKKRDLAKFFSLSWLAVIILFIPLSSLAAYTYNPMEPIPGFGAVSDFPTYILNIYKFGIWTVGIAALLMISIGGFMYFTSAGNTAKLDQAKKVIFDALYGLIVALAAYLLLYVINPDLVKVNISLKPVAVSTTPTPTKPGYPTAACKSVTSGACAVSNMQSSCFSSVADQASAICWGESGGRETIGSGVDKCQPGGETVSWGLFQINLSANQVAGLNCPSAFSQVYTGSNHNCTITNQTLYQQCVAAAKTASSNIQAACSIYNSGGWSRWGFYTRNCKSSF